jgi:cation/acetate symporter
MMGIFSTKMNKEGAIGMLAGLFSDLVLRVYSQGLFFIKEQEYLGMIGGANSFFGITPGSFWRGRCHGQLSGVAVAKVTAPPAHIQAMVEAVRIPWIEMVTVNRPAEPSLQ